MPHFTRPGLGLLLSLPLVAGGSMACMWGWGATDVDRPALALTQMRDVHVDYHDACDRWTSPGDAGDMPSGHVDDVYAMTDDMIEACNDLVQAGRIDRDDRDDVADMRLRLRDAVDGHRARFDELQDGDAMHDECDDHHSQMSELFDETEDRLRSGGMMSGSGTRGGMM